MLDGGLWRFPDAATAEGSGWTVAAATPVTRRDVALLVQRGFVPEPDPAIFGPAAVEAREQAPPG